MSQEYSNSVYSHDKEPWQRMVLHLTNKLKPICEKIEIFLTIKTRADQSKEEENPLRWKERSGRDLTKYLCLGIMAISGFLHFEKSRYDFLIHRPSRQT